jgi:hypothetical protein
VPDPEVRERRQANIRPQLTQEKGEDVLEPPKNNFRIVVIVGRKWHRDVTYLDYYAGIAIDDGGCKARNFGLKSGKY